VIVPFWTCIFDPHLCLDHLLSTTACSTRSCSRCIWSRRRWWGSPPTVRCTRLVFSYLPVMSLPLYASWPNSSPRAAGVASDLGSSPRQAFWLVTFRCSLPVVGAGVLLFFIPIVGESSSLIAAGSRLADDRRPVAGILHQNDWAGCLGGGGGACCLLLLRHCAVRPPAARPIRGAMMMRAPNHCPASTSRRGRWPGLLYLPIVIL